MKVIVQMAPSRYNETGTGYRYEVFENLAPGERWLSVSDPGWNIVAVYVIER